jgi:hypothetical protein
MFEQTSDMDTSQNQKKVCQRDFKNPGRYCLAPQRLSSRLHSSRPQRWDEDYRRVVLIGAQEYIFVSGAPITFLNFASCQRDVKGGAVTFEYY